MARLKTREIVIIVIAVLFVLYAGVDYFIIGPASHKKVKSGAEAVKIETFTSGITGDLNKNKLSDFDRYVVKRAGIDIGNNPFLKRDVYRAWAARDNKGITSKFIYSGFVESGKNRMAVLNGLEYRAGEQLVEEGYTLKQITPSKVLIFDKRTGNSFEVPIQE
ncbi:MAG TPA: hypothetical protein VMU29_01645 [Smithella sp.]|nr:hypothetical protein [Smithella sp.]